MKQASDPESYAASKFQEIFGEKPQGIYQSPGRVNLIGEHTDYNDGFVLPVAIQFRTAIAASAREDNIIEAVALDLDASHVTIDLSKELDKNPAAPWSNYLVGVVREFKKRGLSVGGMNLTISGNVPQGAGLSSSASFEVAIASAMSQLYGISLSGEDAALIGQAAENNFVGCNCGIMDQLVSSLGKKGHAMLLDCRSLDKKFVSIPEELELVIINSNVKRGLVGSEYNVRRQQCESAALYFGVKALRDISIEQLEESKDKLEEVVYRRARHIITENTRTKQAADALAGNQITILSQLMYSSHISMRDDFEITVPAVDTLVEIVKKQIGNEGGVRMTGGGFGGCVVTLVQKAMSFDVVAAVEKEYESKTGLKESVYICTTDNGGFSEPSLD